MARRSGAIPSGAHGSLDRIGGVVSRGRNAARAALSGIVVAGARPQAPSPSRADAEKTSGIRVIDRCSSSQWRRRTETRVVNGVRFWIATLFMTLGIVPPAMAQNIQDAMKPFVSATDLRAVERDARGNLWIATGGGAARFGLANHDWEVFPRLLGTGPRGNDLVTLCIDSQERIWVGSASRGF